MCKGTDFYGSNNAKNVKKSKYFQEVFLGIYMRSRGFIDILLRFHHHALEINSSRAKYENNTSFYPS